MAPLGSDARQLAILAGLGLAADHAYYFAPPGPSRAWCEHVMMHAAWGYGWWIARGWASSWLWAWACWTLVLNRGQSAMCGAATWAGLAGDWAPGVSDLCVQWLGRDIYAAAAALTGAALIVGGARWRTL